ncbi:MAG TPA: hypothetical protein PKB14_05905 [Rubrivivax sp.]|nr:hypothetical protein [Rubrivivax sp.]
MRATGISWANRQRCESCAFAVSGQELKVAIELMRQVKYAGWAIGKNGQRPMLRDAQRGGL